MRRNHKFNQSNAIVRWFNAIDRSSLAVATASLFLNIGLWIYLAATIRYQEGLIFLHYNIYFGVDLIGEWYRIYLLPSVGAAFLLLNTYLALLAGKHDLISSRLVAWLTALLQIILFVAAYLVVQING